MGYSPNHITNLHDQIAKISLDEFEKSPRAQLLKLVKALDAVIVPMFDADAGAGPLLFDAYLGGVLHCMEKINNEFYVHSPEYKVGKIYNSGDVLYSRLKDSLAFDPELQTLSARDKLIKLNRLYQFIVKNADKLTNELKDSGFTMDQLLGSIRETMALEMKVLTKDVAKILNAVPTEKSIDKHLEALPSDYKQHRPKPMLGSWNIFNKPNTNRLFLTQLAYALSTIQDESDEGYDDNVMTRSQRLKMGGLLYIVRKISREYWIRSPFNSTLYSECARILNIKNVDSLDVSNQIVCLAVLQSYLQNPQAAEKLEQFGRTHFGKESQLNNIDYMLRSVSLEVDSMIIDLRGSAASRWPATVAMAGLGAWLGSIPAYGLGSTVGTSLSQVDCMNPAVRATAQGVNVLSMVLFGGSYAGSYGLAAGNFIVCSTLSRGFAQIFAILGAVVGASAGAAVGFTFDLSYKGLRELCVYTLDLCEAQPELMRNVDKELVTCLLEMPQELFAQDKQNQIRYVSGTDVKVEGTVESKDGAAAAELASLKKAS